MSVEARALVRKLWEFCDVLRDDGLSYGDYLEQLTYLLFLKMADEQTELLGGERVVPVGFDWQSLLLNRSGASLEWHYSRILSELGSGDDMLGVVFHKARNRIQTPAKLEQLVKDFIGKHEWLSYDADVKGDAYEGLIEKTAQEGARGAGQYFTPRALISAIVDVMRPRPGQRICDPACGTGGFLLGAYRSIVDRFSPLEPHQVEYLRSGAFTGWEIADLPARLCAMNLLLHGIETPESDSPIHVDDALRAGPRRAVRPSRKYRPSPVPSPLPAPNRPNPQYDTSSLGNRASVSRKLPRRSQAPRSVKHQRLIPRGTQSPQNGIWSIGFSQSHIPIQRTHTAGGRLFPESNRQTRSYPHPQRRWLPTPCVLEAVANVWLVVG